MPREIDPLALDTLAAVASPRRAAAALTLGELAAVLYYAAGVTRRKNYPGGGEILFRAAASTGALYQTEVYAAVGEVAGLEAGLYHFCPGDFALRRLRAGDVRAALAAAAADETIASRAATIVLTGIYWRNAWKYQARAYRHLFWDSGTMLANLLAVAGGLGLAPRVLTGFVDVEVSGLLGLDPAREVALELVALGAETAPAPAEATYGAIDHPTLPLSSSEVDYPLVREIHSASSLATPDAVRAWRRPRADAVTAPRAHTANAPRVVALPAPRTAAGRSLGETIQRRGSTRQFGHAPLTAEELGTALWAAATFGIGRRISAWSNRSAGTPPPSSTFSLGSTTCSRVSAIAAIGSPTWRPGSPAVGRISPRTPRASAPPVSRSTTRRWSSSSRRTPPARTRSS